MSEGRRDCAMRVMFVGSFPKDSPPAELVKKNLRRLVATMAGQQTQFVIRNPPSDESIPVDGVVYECLEKCLESGKIDRSAIHLTVIKEGGRPDGFSIGLLTRISARLTLTVSG